MRNPGPLVALALVAMIGAGAGCSDAGNESDASGSGGADRNDAAKTAADNGEQGVKFAECMREEGVSDFPDPNASGEFEYGVSVSPAVWKRTVEACKHLQPPGTLSADRTPEEQSAALEFAQCVRENGVEDFPDPVEGDPLIDTTQIPSSDTPEGMTILNAATEKCGELAADALAGQ